MSSRFCGANISSENERLKRIIASYLARESADQQVIAAQISPVADEVPAQITKEATPIPLEPMEDDNYDAFLDEYELFYPNIFMKLEKARRLATQASWSSESVNRSMLNLTDKMDIVVEAFMEQTHAVNASWARVLLSTSSPVSILFTRLFNPLMLY